MKKYFIICLLVCVNFFSEAQISKKNLLIAVNAISNTELLNEFKSVKIEMEQYGKEFKDSLKNYSFSERRKLIKNYTESKVRFDNVLDKMKRDLVNRNKRKEILSNPNLYTNELKDEFDEAYKYYEDNFVKNFYDIVYTSKYKAGELRTVLNIVLGAVKIINEVSSILDEMKAEFLEEQLFSKIRIKPFGEL